MMLSGMETGGWEPMFENFIEICTLNPFRFEPGRIHGYLSRVRVGRGGEKKAKCYGRTDGPTDRQTDRAGCRVACTRLKILQVTYCIGLKYVYSNHDYPFPVFLGIFEAALTI